MKIVHFKMLLHPQYGGPSFSVPVQCNGIANEGEEVTLVTYPESRPFEEKLIKTGVKIAEVEDSCSGFLRKIGWPVRRWLKRNNDADIFHYHGVWSPNSHWISLFARKRGVNVVMNPRGDLEIARLKYDSWKRLKKRVAWAIYGKKDTQSTNCIIATSEQEYCAIRSMGITTPVAVIPNGIELESFPQRAAHKAHEIKVVLFLSRVNPIKGLEYLINAWKDIPDYLKNSWQLHIVGNSDPKNYVDELQKRVLELGLSETIKFLGPITGEDKIRKYEQSDIFVLPTLNENFGNVIAEAMMCELPVITTKNAPWKVIDDYKCGWWIDLSTENLLSTLKKAMMLSDEERWELGERGRKCIKENFAAPVVAKKTIELYKWVLGKAEMPDCVNLK